LAAESSSVVAFDHRVWQRRASGARDRADRCPRCNDDRVGAWKHAGGLIDGMVGVG
jgi:hypothetical protein